MSDDDDAAVSSSRIRTNALGASYGLESILNSRVVVTAGGIRYHSTASCVDLLGGQEKAALTGGPVHPTEWVDLSTAIAYRPMRARQPCTTCVDPDFGRKARGEYFQPFIDLWQTYHETLTRDQQVRLSNDQRLDKLIRTSWESIVFAVSSSGELSKIIETATWHQRSGGIADHIAHTTSIADIMTLLAEIDVEVIDKNHPGWEYFVGERRSPLAKVARKVASATGAVSASAMREAWRRRMT